MAAAGVEKKAWSPLAIIMFKASEPEIAFPVQKRRYFHIFNFPVFLEKGRKFQNRIFSITFCVTFALSSLLFSFFSPFVVWFPARRISHHTCFFSDFFLFLDHSSGHDFPLSFSFFKRSPVGKSWCSFLLPLLKRGAIMPLFAISDDVYRYSGIFLKRLKVGSLRRFFITRNTQQQM